MQVTVGPKYQIVIPKEVRRKIKDLKPGTKVSVGSTSKDVIIIKTSPKDWVERARGIAKEAWKGIDTTRYLDDLRNEWDRQS